MNGSTLASESIRFFRLELQAEKKPDTLAG